MVHTASNCSLSGYAGVASNSIAKVIKHIAGDNMKSLRMDCSERLLNKLRDFHDEETKQLSFKNVGYTLHIK